MRVERLLTFGLLVWATQLGTACTADDPATPAAAATSTAAAGTGGGGAGTGASGGATGVGGAGGSAGSGGAPDVDKSASCADTFGDELTDSFGRLDGTVLALVAPTDTQCPLVNNDHLVIQVTLHEAVYRMVVNVADIYFAEKDAPLAGAAWAEGWHTDATLDYATVLDVHSADFTQHTQDELVTMVSAPIEIGAKISVYATSSGGTYASSAHLVHRNGGGADGAIVIDPTSATAHYLLFRFDNQTF